MADSTQYTPSLPGNWQHGYFEAYIQYNANGSSSSGWPAFWSWPTQGGAEVDFLEVGINAYGGTIHYPAGQTTVGQTWQVPRDSEWHDYGCLWQSTGSGTGSLTFYIDNVQVGNPFPTGTGTSVPNMESNSQALALGTGTGWPINIDYVKVWQSP
jgi:hypothetical protein